MSIHTDEASSAPPLDGRWRRGLWVARAVAVRLRFPALLALILGIVLGWETLSTRAWRLADRLLGAPDSEDIVSSTIEYFCPMDPGVLSDWPSKCPICNMALVRRERGDMAPLPDGVLARVQLTPYRVQLGGVSASEVAFLPLERRLAGPARPVPPEGPGGPGRVVVELFADEAAEVRPGMRAEVEQGGITRPASVVGVEAGGATCEVSLLLDDGPGGPPAGSPLRAAVRLPAAELPPSRDRPRDPPPLRPGEPRVAYRCGGHPEVVREAAGTCPIDRSDLVPTSLSDDRRLCWWCPMHPKVTADAPGASCDSCGGMTLVPRIVAYAPPGQVLAVPETAVLDSGTRRVVYLERMPGVFEAVEVELGPRCGAFYPVASGLEPGQRVVTVGTFLVDAETRLTPGLATAYFGATSRSDPAAAPPTAPRRPSGADRAAIERQGTCPVTGLKLGSMGEPAPLVIRGRTVFLCCAGCRPKVEADPERYLAELPPGPESP